MADYYDCEPLNLVKRKSKPVAVVAPSAAVAAGEGGRRDEEEEEVEDLSLKKEPGRQEAEDLTRFGREVHDPKGPWDSKDLAKGAWDSKIAWESKEDVNKNWEPFGVRPPACDPALLTALYMRSLYPVYAPDALWAHRLLWQARPQKSPSAASSTASSAAEGAVDLAAAPRNAPEPEPEPEPPRKNTKNPKQKRSSMDHKNSLNDKSQDSGHTSNNQDKKKPHIKKPLNAFMLYMKEMRAKVVAECTLKESAAINQILGRRWHALGRDEQAKYYELARRERQLHMQLYPDWSSRANTNRGKKRKRKQETNDGGNSMKKCRARYGLDQQSQWCKPCRRKKKCIRYMECGEDGNQSDDNLGSCGSAGEEAGSPPDEDDEGTEESGSYRRSASSPGGLSGLSSLTSPSMILPSPSASMASPSVSLASPCVSLQSPLTPHQAEFDCKQPPPPCLPLLVNHHLYPLQPMHPPRHPVGTNPHDANNPLSVNQLTGKCIKSDPDDGRPAISVT